MDKANFSKIFNEIYASNGKELQSIHKQVLIRRIILIIVPIVMIYTCPFVMYYFEDMKIVISIIYIFIVAVYFMSLLHQNRLKADYKVNYKNSAIIKLIKEVDDSYEFMPNTGINMGEYRSSKFDLGVIDEFYSEDGIIGNINESTRFKMSQVKTIRIVETVDSEGHRTRSRQCTFLGLYGIIYLPMSFEENILISNDSKSLKYNSARVEMESEEFEKYFDVFAFDRQKAMEILTPNTIEELIKIRNSIKKGGMQFKIAESKIFFRLSCGDIFEPPSFKSGLDFDVLYSYFTMIQLPKTIYEALIDNILLIINDKQLLRNRRADKMTDEERKKYEEELQQEEESKWFSTK